MTRVSKADRQQVRNRANGRCEYCRRPERYTPIIFHVDHIIPVKRHLGSKGLFNLAWACSYCNRNKETDVASYDIETGDLTPLYNPRTQRWDDHFYMDGPIILGKTSIGRVTVRLLDMNHPDYVEARQILIELHLW